LWYDGSIVDRSTDGQKSHHLRCPLSGFWSGRVLRLSQEEAMLHHLVFFELSDSATDADRDAIIDGLESMPAVVPEIQSYTVGAALPSPNASWSIALIGVFASVDDYKSYSANPVHQKLVADVIRPKVKNVTSAQIES
jgi:hypothetical protein